MATRGLIRSIKGRSPTQPKPRPQVQNLEDLRAWAREQAAARPAEPAPSSDRAVSVQEPTPSVRDRPTAISDMVGQKALVGQLRLICAGSILRGTPMPHCLITGPSGHGKTTLASIIANEIGAHLVCTNGMLLRRPGDLVGLLVKMRPNSALLVDEIHSLPKPVAEVLYEVLEDGKLSTLVGSGAETVAVTHQMEGFVCIGATTRPGLLSAPFRGRFGFVGQVDPYSADELAEIVTKAWQRAGVEASEGEALAVATRCRYVPRRALHLAERVLDWTSVAGIDGVPSGTVSAALAAFGIDELGLDGNDWRVLAALTQTFSGRTVGLDALGSALDMDAASIENEIEPYLIQSGYISRTKSGRMGLPLAYELFRETA